ncbi:NTP transferase domain-containing protein [Candidatus Gottesmanbacteria bacterium]|nr:NTP transferase domain-containing protein [Candidatus Gottesmanbacteria bacterium]
MKKDIVAVVLAGGEGKRFWPIQTSKSMIPFLGRPLLVWNLQRLKLTGIADVVVVIHPQDKETFAHLSVPGLTIRTVVQPQPNGMAGAVLSAAPLLKGKSCFIMNAEDLVEEKLYEALKSAMNGQEIVLAGIKKRQYFPAGHFVLKGEHIVGIVEKPGEGNQPSDFINLVFHYFPDSDLFIDALQTATSARDDLYECALNDLIGDGKARIFKYEGFWYPTKYPWHILSIMDALLPCVLDYRGKNVEIKSNVVVDGPVHLGDNVKIFEHTKIVGPCFIGDNTIIGNNNIIRHSQIGAGCVTGFNTDITRSYIGDNCWFHSNYIGDSILEEDVSMGSGNVLANLRLDEGEIHSVVRGEKINTKRTKLGAIIGRHVRLGVNTSVMPGVKIGAHSMIGAGLMVDRDVPDGSFVAGGTSLVISKNTRIQQCNRDAFRKKLS